MSLEPEQIEVVAQANSELGQNADPVGKELLVAENSVEQVGHDLGYLSVDVPHGPPEVQRRVKALKKIQMEMTQVESQFFKEMHELEAKYSPLYTKYFEKRSQIISGNHEPTDEECEFCLDDKANPEKTNGSPEANENGNRDPSVPLAENTGDAKPVSGIPDFWITIFRNVERLSDMVHDSDVPILKHLTDIKVEITKEPAGFKLLFHFSPNEYFSNSVLTKTYEMKCDVDPKDPFAFEGPEIVKCTGCNIDWKEGKNITVRTVMKKQKHKQSGAIRMVSKTEEVPSFFEFFTPPQIQDDEDVDTETQFRLTGDFEVGQYIRERIVPRAILYYTGEALDDEEYDTDIDEEDEDEEETEPDGEGDEAGGDTEED